MPFFLRSVKTTIFLKKFLFHSESKLSAIFRFFCSAENPYKLSTEAVAGEEAELSASRQLPCKKMLQESKIGSRANPNVGESTPF